MAFFTPSCLISEIRGSVGASTFSRNKYGPVVKKKLTQTNPNTTKQQAVRTTFATAVSIWQNFSQVQRDYWNEYAKDHTAVNSLGVPIKLSGYNRFISFMLNMGIAGEGKDFPIRPFSQAPVMRDVHFETEAGVLRIKGKTSNEGESQFVFWYVSEQVSSGINVINPSLLRFAYFRIEEPVLNERISDLIAAAYAAPFNPMLNSSVFVGIRYFNSFSGVSGKMRIFRLQLPFNG